MLRQALLEASRLVHSTIELERVLQHAVRVVVPELEMDGVFFTEPAVSFGQIAGASDSSVCGTCPRFALLARGGAPLGDGRCSTARRELSLYETDFLEGLALQTAAAV